MSTRDLLIGRLELVHRWYTGMVDARTGMLAYLYDPRTDSFIRERSPIRDIASVWDVELVEAFLGRAELRPVVERSLAKYVGWLAARDGALVLDPEQLAEPSSIAHSAFLLLALLHAPPPRRAREIAALAEGIRRQQRADGSFRIYFDDLPDSGEELYAGEAMLALLETHGAMGDAGCLDSAARAFRYYDADYFGRGRVSDDIIVYFANWQSQACRLLFELSDDSVLRRDVARFLAAMHERIIDAGLWRTVDRDPETRVSVEVACGLEGLADAWAVAHAGGSAAAATSWRESICTGLAYLLRLQCTAGGTARERGGFGFTLSDRAQRIDITGHAASAFMKIADAGIECPEPGG